ncbi:MAG: hypothetical protein A2068_01540 [Ignavibacteria bacterium GWB2_35_6b]|nr:MAG: hypothetical protein A2068_01540 [Ignavibacteria bacterium GWB2_35_6b]
MSYLLSDLTKRNSSEDEAELLGRIALGDQNSLEKIYDLYSGVIFSLVLRILKRKEDAEEVTQNIFMQIWEKANLFNYEKGTAYTWIINLARNKAIDRLRSKDYKDHKEKLIELDKYDWWQEEKANITIDSLSDFDTIEYVKNALSQLPGEQKQVIEMAYFEGWTQAEIADKLNLPLGTVKTRARQAMIKLQKSLEN